MQGPQITSIFVLVCIWLIGGFKLLYAGLFALMSFSAELAGIFIILILLTGTGLGFALGHFLLAKVARNSVYRAKKLNNTLANYFIGWAKVLAPAGSLILALMLSFAIIFAGANSPFNGLSKALICFTTGMALLIGSFNFGLEFKNKQL
jgi:hypothetical protein